MALYLYDRTFDGFLTLVFETYQNRCLPEAIESFGSYQPLIWSEQIPITTDAEKASRVWKAIKTRLTGRAYDAVFRIHLSEAENSLMLLYRFLQKVFASKINIEENYADPDVLRIKQLDRQICREAEHMKQFVRFQKTADNIFYAAVDPKFNVIPLIVPHFETRFADQQWLIFDSRRKYGFYYNCKETVMINLTSDSIDPHNGKLKEDIMAGEELLFQKLWKEYFRSTCIEERRNEKLQMQHMPKRYWKYLTEKQR